MPHGVVVRACAPNLNYCLRFPVLTFPAVRPTFQYTDGTDRWTVKQMAQCRFLMGGPHNKRYWRIDLCTRRTDFYAARWETNGKVGRSAKKLLIASKNRARKDGRSRYEHRTE